MDKKNRVLLLSLIILLVAILLTGCGKNRQHVESAGQPVLPNSTLTASDARFVFITLDDCYPVDLSTLSICFAEDKKRENSTVLAYNEHVGGYGILLNEGTYEIRLVCDAEQVTYDQHRYISVDTEHSYYHVRFTPNAYLDFD